MNLKICLLREGAQTLTRGSIQAVGYDMKLLHTDEELDLPALTPIKCPTGIAVSIPEGYYGRVAPRSGLGSKGIAVMGGVVDPDYRGEVFVLLMNMTNKMIKIKNGERIAQLILEACSTPEITLCNIIDMDKTDRGAGGFGSSGQF